MPEESFEQQARKMAEQFSMEPQPVVWQRVEAVIAPKRKRRAAFVWWLLPLCVAIGLGFWLLKDKKTIQQNKTFARQIATAKLNSSEQNKVVSDDKKIPQKNNKNKGDISKKYVPVVPKNKVAFLVENKELKTKKNDAKNKDKLTQPQLQTDVSADKNVVKENGEKTENVIMPIQPQTNYFIEKNAVVDFSKMILHNDVKNNIDTAKTNATISAKTNDSLKQNKDSSTITGKKKQTKKKWQIGLLAELGEISLGNGLFANQSTNSLTFSSNPSTISSGSSTIYQHKKMGFDAALGMAIQNHISKRLFFDGQIVYRYQQFGIQTTTFSSLSTALNGNISKSNIDFRLHFASVYTGIGFSIFHRKKTSVAVQAGIDNSWLFTVQQKHNDSLQNLTTQGFQRWQPFVTIAVPVSLFTKNKMCWQLSPFIRWGLRSLQNGYGLLQHQSLNSAGIRAIYFFK